MFNLKRKTKQITAATSQQYEPNRDPKEVVKEIHDEFDGATDELLLNAKKILSENRDTDKGERLKKLGFEYSKSATEAATDIRISKRTQN